MLEILLLSASDSSLPFFFLPFRSFLPFFLLPFTLPFGVAGLAAAALTFFLYASLAFMLSFFSFRIFACARSILFLSLNSLAVNFSTAFACFFFERFAFVTRATSFILESCFLSFNFFARTAISFSFFMDLSILASDNLRLYLLILNALSAPFIFCLAIFISIVSIRRSLALACWFFKLASMRIFLTLSSAALARFFADAAARSCVFTSDFKNLIFFTCAAMVMRSCTTRLDS